ncbi:MAG: amidohydrolase family protein [Bryobacteraceae bacterium]|nr:amidohydrolase family protein [Bryobacteraceae bacterium]
MISRRALMGLLPAGLAAQQPPPRERDRQPAPHAPMSFEEYEPKSSLVVPQHIVKRAKFPFVDMHNHQSAFRGDDADKLVKEMDALNMQVMVNLSGSYGDAFKKSYDAFKGKHPKRFVVFANFTFRDIDAPDYPERVAKQLEDDIKYGAQGLKIFKNFGMDLKDAKGERVHVDDPRYDKAFQVLAKYNAPCFIHTAEPKQFFEPVDKYNERWLELVTIPGRRRPPDKYASWETMMAEQHNLFRRHKNVNFINAHLGWLGGDLAKLGKLMDEMPNMYTEIGAVLAELGRQPRFARQWFIRYQDRVLMGKDTWAPEEYHTYFRVLETADEYFEYYRKRHAFWRMYGLDLPDEVLKKVYYKNALKLVKGIDPSPFPK